jgi:hypothetical protein
MPSKPFVLGSPVLIIGNPCRFTSFVGCFGYISRLEEGGTYWVETLRAPTLEDPYDKAREERGDLSTTIFHVKPSDIRHLTGKDRLARVVRLKRLVRREEVKDKDRSVVNKIMADYDTPEARKIRADEEAAISAEYTRIGQVFKLPGQIKRHDKSDYPAYRDPIAEAISQELMTYAHKGPKACSINERARWKQCLEATNACSFWSPRAECRALVKELDLDPMIDGDETALYRDKGDIYTVNGALRAAALRLWNKGAVILYIQDMESPETCWSSYKGSEPNGYLVSYGFRRKLPI